MRTILLCITLLYSSFVFSVGKNETPEFITHFQAAENYFANEDYESALNQYLILDTIDPGNSNIKFKIGVCYLYMPLDKAKSVSYLEAASKNTSADYKDGSYKMRFAPPFALNYLAHAYHINYKFDQAIEAYKKTTYFLRPDKDKANISDVNLQIQMCQNAKVYVSSPVNLKIENLGPGVNSKWDEYSPVFPADESVMYFTSKRDNNTGGVDEDGDYTEDIFYSIKKDSVTWNQSVNIGAPINTPQNDATIGISVDGQQLVIYKDDNGGDIYTSQLEGGVWNQPVKLNSNVNTPGFEPSGTVTSDANVLYFTSDRPGGYGGRDIYRSKKLPNGLWAKAINLGPMINTPNDEDAPYIHPDNRTLFFASNGVKSMGGYDIFFSTLSDSGTWSEPVNMGYPLNTPDDDAFFTPTADNRRGYYASVKEGGFGEKDIYMVTFPDVREKPLTVLKGTIKGFFETDIPEGVQITVTDNETGELNGVYYPNSRTGKYLLILPPGHNYNVSYEASGFLFHSENVFVADSTAYTVKEQEIALQPIKVGQKIVLKNVFYDVNKATLKPESKTELEKLRELLTRNPKLLVEISGHTDAQGKKADNLKLSQKRAESVRTFLIEHGIASSRIKAVGYGDTQPMVDNYGPDKKLNKAAMELNRRTEVKMTGLVETK